MLEANVGSSRTGESGWDRDDRDLWLEAITLSQGTFQACEAAVAFHRMEAPPLTLSHLLRHEEARS